MSVCFDETALDVLMPMHVRLDEAGVIVGAGPSFLRLAGTRAPLGRKLLECVRISHPARIDNMGKLLETAGRRLHMAFSDGRAVQLRGVMVPTANGAGGLLDLSLGLPELADLGGAGLTSADFSATDPTLDMLYLIEAKTATQAEARRLITRLHEEKIRAEAEAATDTLTGLKNRRAFNLAFADLLAEQVPFAFCLIDLDYFKSVNDAYGHAVGDQVLVRVADVLIRATGQSDVVARLGGDEFAILLRGIVDVEMLERVAQRIIDRIERSRCIGDRPNAISASLGSTLSVHHDAPTAEVMTIDADAALYASKKAGRSIHTIAPAGTVHSRIA